MSSESTNDRSPQVEDGYTRIANELLDEIIQFPFTKRQYKVVLLLARQTYGYNKKTDVMSYGRIAEATGLKRQHVIAVVGELADIRVVTTEGSGVHVRGGELRRFGINKQYSEWGANPKTVTSPEVNTSPKTVTSPKTGLVPKQVVTSPKTGHSLVPKQVPTKDNTTKDNITKDNARAKPRLDYPKWLNQELWQKFVENRKAIKKPMTPNAEELAIKKLGKLVDEGEDQVEVLETAIMNGWQGLFHVKKQGPAGRRLGRTPDDKRTTHNDNFESREYVGTPIDEIDWLRSGDD